MTKEDLEIYVKGRFGTDLCEFFKQKVEIESLYDYEIADILTVKRTFVGQLRKEYKVRRSNGFSRRFERAYGIDAVETFKKMIEDPNNSLSVVGNHFGFSREYARQAYNKIYGRPYTNAYKRKKALKEAAFMAFQQNIMEWEAQDPDQASQ